MKTKLYPADSRGHADHGWLKTNHTFSFANYYNPERIHFGALRVLNDDWIAAGEGFGRHPHDNMEIITIPFTGAVLHQDSIGNKGVIKPGELQVMSAGSGIFHSEFNDSKVDPLTLFQIWIIPNKKNVTPRYDQITISDLAKKDEFYQILSPNTDDQGVWIHQDAWFNMADLSSGKELEYQLQRENSGVFVQLIEGSIEVAGNLLSGRDAIAFTETASVKIKAGSEARVLVMEVPMHW
ncbi:MAG: pirin family protein [Paludibacter sp.]|nr:pirin family protein [Paludibacter sp.]